MELEEAFALADRLIDRVSEDAPAARAAVSLSIQSASAALAAGTADVALSAGAARACAMEAEWLDLAASLPDLVDEATDPARRYFEESSEAPAHKGELPDSGGFVTRLLRRRRPQPAAGAPEQHPLAQAAFAGRKRRMDRARDLAAQAASHVPERREELDSLVFGLQEAALKLSRSSGNSPSRLLYALEATASAFSSHSDRLAVAQRAVSRAASRP